MAGYSVEFTANPAGVDALLHDPSGPYGQWLARIGNQARNGALRRSPVDTGLMRSSITFTVELRGGVLVGLLAAKTHYSWYVHEGTRGRPGRPFLLDGIRDALGG